MVRLKQWVSHEEVPLIEITSFRVSFPLLKVRSNVSDLLLFFFLSKTKSSSSLVYCNFSFKYGMSGQNDERIIPEPRQRGLLHISSVRQLHCAINGTLTNMLTLGSEFLPVKRPSSK